MAKRKRKAKKGPTVLSSGDKATLRRILAKVRRLPRKKKPPVSGLQSPTTYNCQFGAADIIRQSALVKSLAARGISTAAENNFFNQQNFDLSNKLAAFAAAGCPQSLIVGKI